MQVRTVTVGDPQGLHAQTVHRLTSAAGNFGSSVWVRYSGRRASLTDPIQLLALGAPAGAQLTVMADGLDEAEALTAICGLITARPD